MDFRETALQTAATLLRPIASFMLKCGLTWREFSALAKSAFVAAATEEYGINGRPTNISRVALLCGLSRKEVRRQRDLLADPLASTSESKTTEATQVLSAWFQESAYQDKNGNPRTLSRESFDELSGTHCRELTASGMLKELLRVGAVAELPDGNLEVKIRFYMPTNTDSEWKVTASHYVADLARSISHNVDLDKSERSRFLGRATVNHVPVASIDDFRQFLEDEGQDFLERVDAWLSENQLSEEHSSNHKTVRLGVGVFQIQDESTQHTPTSDTNDTETSQG